MPRMTSRATINPSRFPDWEAVGPEQSPLQAPKRGFSKGAAQNPAQLGPSLTQAMQSELAEIVAAWASRPDETRRAVLAAIRSGGLNGPDEKAEGINRPGNGAR